MSDEEDDELRFGAHGQRGSFVSPGEVSTAFLNDKADFKYIEGPFGSGKSTTAFEALLEAAMEQEPNQFGIRKTKWFILRKTYKDLDTATFPTMMEHLPPNPLMGITYKMSKTPRLEMRVRGADWKGQRTKIVADFVGISAENQSQIDNWRGYQFTGGWVNEPSELDESVVGFIAARAGRYPPMDEGGPTRPLIVGDYNPPDSDHWLVRQSENPTRGTAFYLQAPAILWDLNGNAFLNKKAENLHNIPPGYYLNAIDRYSTQNPVFLKKFYGGERISLSSKSAVFGELFDANFHTGDFEPEKGMPIWVGADFGNFPAAVFVQLMSNGQIRVLEELAIPNLDINRYAEEIIAKLRSKYSMCNFQSMIGDPAGRSTSWMSDFRSVFQILAGKGLLCIPCSTNDVQARIEAVRHPLRTNITSTTPSIIINRRGCPKLITGFKGEYQWKLNSEKVPEAKIVKNEYSHPHDALQYALVHIKNISLMEGGFHNVVPQTRQEYLGDSDRFFPAAGDKPIKDDIWI